MDVVREIAAEREQLIAVRGKASPEQLAIIDVRLVHLEDELIDAVKVKKMAEIDEAKNTDDKESLCDDFTIALINVRARRDTFETLVDDIHIMEGVGFEP